MEAYSNNFYQIPQIYGDKDADGFFLGELNGIKGFVPYNMVEEVDDPGNSPAPPPSPHSPQKRTGTGTGTGTLSSMDGVTGSPGRDFSSSLNTTTTGSPGKYCKTNCISQGV